MENKPISRRKFLGHAGLAGLGVLALGSGAFSCKDTPNSHSITGSLLGPDMKNGHRIRQTESVASVTKSVETSIVIVGGGVAGLACAWQLRQKGFRDFLLLEMESECGGNARGGTQNGLRHPWGAHYLPVPDVSNTRLMEFLTQIDVVKGYDLNNRPIFNELFLCHSPQERLQIHGIWQNGLVPHTGVPTEELAEIHRFFEEMAAWKTKLGSDGKPAFCIPAETSSQDPEILRLDAMTMAEYLRSKDYESAHLHWYIDYCCRDDYGMRMEECSAWAGIHYFAARSGGGANAESGAVLTWPEGNAWLTGHLSKGLVPDRQVMQRQMVFTLGNTPDGVQALTHDLDHPGDPWVVLGQTAVFAGPQFVAKHIVRGYDRSLEGFDYAPWLVANILVDLKSHELLHGLHWDNVAYGRSSLGYVYAGHQSLAQHKAAQGVLTWYEPLTSRPPAEARKWLQTQDYATLRDYVLADMEFMHPGISAHIEQVDIWPWGHGMVRPVPGLITGAALRQTREPIGRIHFAHSDLSGISIFEEAFHRGTLAAEAALRSIKG